MARGLSHGTGCSLNGHVDQRWKPYIMTMVTQKQSFNTFHSVKKIKIKKKGEKKSRASQPGGECVGVCSDSSS